MLLLFLNVTFKNEGNIVREAVIVSCQNYMHKYPIAHAMHIISETI